MKYLRTRRDIDGHDILSELVADVAGDRQVHLRSHRDLMGCLAVDVGSLLLEGLK